MKRAFVFIFLVFFSNSAFSRVEPFYGSEQAAHSACNAEIGNCPSHTQTSYTEPTCSGSANNVNLWYYYQYPSVYNFYYCATGFKTNCSLTNTILDSSGTQCVNPCPASGTEVTKSVKVSSDTGLMVIQIGGATETIVSDGCSYTYKADSSLYSDCYRNAANVQYCNVKATSTQVVSSPNTAAVLSSADSPVPPATKPTCVNGRANDGSLIETCLASQVSGIAEINGVPVKVRPDTVEINGVPVTPTSPKNCGTVNGQYTCVSSQAGSLYGTVGSGGTVTYWKFRPESSTTTQTVTNPDGSITKTETTTDNVIGSEPLIKTTVTNQNGDTNVTIKGGQTGSAAQTDSAALQAIAKGVGEMGKGMDLSTVNKNTGDTATNTKGILDKLGEFLGTSSNNYDTSFDHSASDTAKATDEQGLNDFVNAANPLQDYYDSHSFATALASFFPNVGSCSGGIHWTGFGRTVDIEPCARLSVLREILAWFFSVMTAWSLVNIATKTLTR